MRHLVLLSIVLIGAQPAAGASARAQDAPQRGTIMGVVRDTSGAPIAYAEVTGTAGRVLTDSLGGFVLRDTPAGRAGLQVRRIGYRAASWMGTLRVGETLAAELTLVPIARELQAVVVDAPGGNARQMRGFYLRRQRSYGGHFLTREQIAPYDESRMSDLLRARVPGVSVSSAGTGRTRLRLRSQRCAPMVYIDGASTPAAEFDVDVIQPFTVAAIEVYAGVATIPAEFRTSFGRDNCGGAIVIWSRLGTVDDEPGAEQVARAPAGPPMAVYHADEVDEPAAIDTANLVQPAYPDSLRAFAVAGEVVARFVVDTDGAPVAGTVEILSATHDVLTEAVRRAIALSLFVPARRNGQAVRQVMVVPFQFRAPER